MALLHRSESPLRGRIVVVSEFPGMMKTAEEIRLQSMLSMRVFRWKTFGRPLTLFRNRFVHSAGSCGATPSISSPNWSGKGERWKPAARPYRSSNRCCRQISWNECCRGRNSAPKATASLFRNRFVLSAGHVGVLPSSPNEDGGRGQNAAQQSVRSYINQANEPFGAYIPNGSFAFTPSPDHRQGGSNHPREWLKLWRPSSAQSRGGLAWRRSTALPYFECQRHD